MPASSEVARPMRDIMLKLCKVAVEKESASITFPTKAKALKFRQNFYSIRRSLPEDHAAWQLSVKVIEETTIKLSISNILEDALMVVDGEGNAIDLTPQKVDLGYNKLKLINDRTEELILADENLMSHVYTPDVERNLREIYKTKAEDEEKQGLLPMKPTKKSPATQEPAPYEEPYDLHKNFLKNPVIGDFR